MCPRVLADGWALAAAVPSSLPIRVWQDQARERGLATAMTAAAVTPRPGPRRRGDILAPSLSASAPWCRVIFSNDTFWFQVLHALAFASQANTHWLDTTTCPLLCGRRRALGAAPPGPSSPSIGLGSELEGTVFRHTLALVELSRHPVPKLSPLMRVFLHVFWQSLQKERL